MRKKLIEAALPLKAINKASSKEKSIRHCHPSTLHLWWARRPLAATRAVVFASLVDDPSSLPEEFPDEVSQNAERERLFKIIEDLVVWENSNDPEILAKAKAEIKKSCGRNLPELLDPFAGGGSIPLEAQRLGLKVQASDLNPVAVMINKAMLEIPAKFAGLSPINPKSVVSGLKDVTWTRAHGLAEDVAYYAEILKDKAFERVGQFYPKVKGPGQEGSSLESTVLAWLWARTVKCPNPACGLATPLVSSFTLAKREKKEVYAQPILKNGQIVYEIKTGKPELEGTVNRQGARCVVCKSPIKFPYIREEGKNNRLGASLMAIVAESQNGRVYLPPDELQVEAAKVERIVLEFDQNLPSDPRSFMPPLYGMTDYSDLFTARQLIFLTTLTDLVPELLAEIEKDAITAGMANDGIDLEEGGTGAKAYGQAMVVYLSVLIDKLTDFHSSLCSWVSVGEKISHTFVRQALSMVWDYAEGNPFSGGTGSFQSMTSWVVKALKEFPANGQATVKKADAMSAHFPKNIIISTDPPYYDNIGYANLSDYFYIWLRQSLKKIYKSVFTTIMVHKSDELVADPYRLQRGKEAAKLFFENGLKKVFSNFYQCASTDFPLTIFYAFKQKEAEGVAGDGKMASTGWETMLAALIDSGFAITGTWPIKTERGSRMRAISSNALASSIVLICRKRPQDAGPCSRQDFLRSLRAEFKPALLGLQNSNIAPVDLAQAAIGPGMAVYSRFSKILEPDGSVLSVRKALGLINEELDKYLTELEGTLDIDSRLCLAFFSQFGLEKFKYGEADVMARAKNASIDGLKEKGAIYAQKGEVRLFGLEEIPTNINPKEDNIWLLAHQLTYALKKHGMDRCAEIAITVERGEAISQARALAYLLYGICEKKKWSKEAFDYNSLVQAWPEIQAIILDLLANGKATGDGSLF
jgi:putative DNA methylase